jgi:hypothetical protein
MTRLRNPRILIIIGSLSLIAFNVSQFFFRWIDSTDLWRGFAAGSFLGISAAAYLLAARRQTRCQ